MATNTDQNSEIIVVSSEGKKKSVSIDRILFDLFCIKAGSKENAIEEIRANGVKNFKHLSSRLIRRYLLFSICDPAIKREYHNN